MADDLNLLAPIIIVLATAGVIIIADLFVREKRWLAVLSLAGMAGAAGYAATFLIRDTRASGFERMLIVDDFSLFFTFLFLGIGGLVTLASVDYVRRMEDRQGEYYALSLLSLGGMILLASTRDLIAIYVSLELVSIPLYALAAFLKDDRSTEAGLKYLLLGAISSATLLYGFAFLYGISGTTSLDGIADAVAQADEGTRSALILATAFVAAGFGFKMAVVPFQMWAPDVYEGAPTPVTAFLSVGSKAAGFAIVLRVFYEGLGDEFISDDWSMVFAVIAAASMIVGNVVAIQQTNIKRMLGYSSIAQAGYFLVGVAAITADQDQTLGASGVLFFLAAYAFTNLAAFIAIIAISSRIGSDKIGDFAGMGRRSPWLAIPLAIGMMSLTGVPPTAGFIAKIYIFYAAVQADLEWLVVIAVVNTVFSAFYYIGVVRAMFVTPAASEERVGAGLPIGAALGIATVGVLVFGFIPAPLIDMAEQAAGVLRVA